MWQAYVNGSSNYWEAGVGIVRVSLEGIKVEKSFRMGFRASNNEAVYKAFLAWLRIARQAKADRLTLWRDSRLIMNQVNGEFETIPEH